MIVRGRHYVQDGGSMRNTVLKLEFWGWPPPFVDTGGGHLQYFKKTGGGRGVPDFLGGGYPDLKDMWHR